jgi:hypothetical protein
MPTEQKRPSDEGKMPEANTGNASNPSPDNNPFDRPDTKQILDEKADTYIRESANIEDEPDAREQQEADEQLATEENNKE